MIQLQNVFKFFLILLFIVSQSSCARTATSRNIELSVQFKIKFKSEVNTDEMNYFILLSNTNKPLIPELEPPVDYLPTPGRPFDETNEILSSKGGINFYYQNYFSTWSDYIYVKSNTAVELYKSNSNSFDPNTNNSNNSKYFPENNFFRNQQYTLSITGNELTISFKPTMLSNNSNLLSFNIITSKKSDITKNGVINDFISSSIYTISTNTVNQIGPFQDISNNGALSSGDIIEWGVSTF